MRTRTAAAVTADVLPASIPGQCHEVLTRTGTFAPSVTSAPGDRAAPRFRAPQFSAPQFRAETS